MDNNDPLGLLYFDTVAIQPLLMNVATVNRRREPGVLRQVAAWDTMMEVVAGLIPEGLNWRSDEAEPIRNE